MALPLALGSAQGQGSHSHEQTSVLLISPPQDLGVVRKAETTCAGPKIRFLFSEIQSLLSGKMFTKLQISPSSKQLISSVSLSHHCWKDSSAPTEARQIFPFPYMLYLGPRRFGITSGEKLNPFKENKMQRWYLGTSHVLSHHICFSQVRFGASLYLNFKSTAGYIFTFWFKYISNVSVSLLLLQINRISQKDGWHFCCYRNWSWCYTACLPPICHTSILLWNTDIFLFHKELYLKN